jgi:Family of unknown function (DUF6152)
MRQLGAIVGSRASPKLTHGAELPAHHPVRTICAVAAALLFATFRISAHHAFSAEYDANKSVSVSGTVTRFEFTNPHAWLYVDGWSFEMGSPNGLLHRGWRRTELKKGDQVTVEGFRAKDGRKVANASTVTLPDGRKLFGGFQTTPGAPRK